mmetsp:Transcript_4818/g.15583  ORF Transcript_4818/g.15583 Transcript_4818/m.15583 type:complete len:167 (+) Transcript_4818:295-795(+)
MRFGGEADRGDSYSTSMSPVPSAADRGERDADRHAADRGDTASLVGVLDLPRALRNNACSAASAICRSRVLGDGSSSGDGPPPISAAAALTRDKAEPVPGTGAPPTNGPLAKDGEGCDDGWPMVVCVAVPGAWNLRAALAAPAVLPNRGLAKLDMTLFYVRIGEAR